MDPAPQAYLDEHGGLWPVLSGVCILPDGSTRPWSEVLQQVPDDTRLDAQGRVTGIAHRGPPPTGAAADYGTLIGDFDLPAMPLGQGGWRIAPDGRATFSDACSTQDPPFHLLTGDAAEVARVLQSVFPAQPQS